MSVLQNMNWSRTAELGTALYIVADAGSTPENLPLALVKIGASALLMIDFMAGTSMIEIDNAPDQVQMETEESV